MKNEKSNSNGCKYYRTCGGDSCKRCPELLRILKRQAKSLEGSIDNLDSIINK